MSLADAKAAYSANKLYDLNGSASQAAAFIGACRDLLILQTQSSSFEDASQAYDVNLIRMELEKAELWWRANSGSVPNVTFASFRFGRGEFPGQLGRTNP